MHEELLPEGAIPVASILAQWPAMQQFYLAGGTGLALHLGHRQSRDLDFFTRDPREEIIIEWPRRGVSPIWHR